jgi:hypothetical protein
MALRDRLVADWRQSWRFFSVQIGIAAGAAVQRPSSPPRRASSIDLLQAPLIQRVVVGG